MSCYSPLYALDFGLNSEGKHIIKVLPRHSDMSFSAFKSKYGDNIMVLPCGQCVGCRLDYSRSWAQRAVLEASLHENNVFITLTYDDAHLPTKRFLDKETGELKDIGVLVKKDLQDFMKRLRRHFDYNGWCSDIRFFGCGEYGDKFNRPHFHVILFNCDFTDKTLFKRHLGNDIYISQILDKLWGKGFASIGAVSFQSCAYVARYVFKKQIGKNRSQDLASPFVLMSRRPGLAKGYFDEHKSDIYKTDAVYFDFGNVKSLKPNKYFDYLAASVIPNEYAEVKGKRLKTALAMVDKDMFVRSVSYLEELNIKKEDLKNISLKNLKR